MRKFEYSETEHFDKTKKLEDMHYQSIVRIIDMENNMLADEENNLANKLYELSKKKEFKDLMEDNPVLKDVYKNLVRLYSEYNEKKNPFNVEKNICDEINSLDVDENFKKSVSMHPEMKQIFDRLKKLYLQYEEKQKLYDKLDQIENDEKKTEKKK
jgi:hypothetical protein